MYKTDYGLMIARIIEWKYKPWMNTLRSDFILFFLSLSPRYQRCNKYLRQGIKERQEIERAQDGGW